MTFRDLEYLVAVADLGHFGRAAARCHASQSALSLQLQKLEAGLGVQLVERTNRRVVITPTGLALVARARHLLQGRQELLDEAALDAGQAPREVTVGMIPTIAPYQLGGMLAAMRAAHPDTIVRVVEDVTSALVQSVARGELDAAILATPVDDTLLEETPLMEDEMLLAVAAGHSLARRKVATPQDLAREKLLLLRDGHCLRDQALSFCAALGGMPAHHSVATSIETLKALIRAGQGVTLMPRMAVREGTSCEGLAYVPVRPAPKRLIRIVTRRTSRLGRLLAAALVLATQKLA